MHRLLRRLSIRNWSLRARLLAGVVGLGTAATLVVLVIDAFKSGWVDVRTAAVGSASGDGSAIFRSWVLPFEVVSVLLLAALVGAIVLVRKDSDEPADGEG